jgi:hypothetical protein
LLQVPGVVNVTAVLPSQTGAAGVMHETPSQGSGASLQVPLLHPNSQGVCVGV